MRRFALLFAAISAATLGLYLAPEKHSAKTDKFRRSDRPVAGSYIVMLDDAHPGAVGRTVSERVRELAADFHGSVKTEYTAAIPGFSAEMSEPEAIRLSADPRVKLVEEDAWVETSGVQTGATWGISRVDQRQGTIPSDTEYEYNATGAGVTIYVVDTGIWVDNPDFAGRAVHGYDAYRDTQRMTECNGHGTHVAGIAGSSTYGIAKNSNIVSVKVFPCTGLATVSDVISGIDWVSRNAVRPAVANMSFTTGRSSTVDNAVAQLINSGVTVTVAAGNEGLDACNYSPASATSALTVGSTYYTDARPSATNYGRCLDLFAPGVAITSTWNKPDMAANTISGTSMAAPHVAGVAALYLEQYPQASPAQVEAAILSNATPDIVANAGNGSPNLLLYSQISTGGGGGSSCTGSVYSASISGPGGISLQSSKDGFSSRAGNISGRLSVPEGAGFRLHLERKQNGRSYVTLASSPGSGSTESVEFTVRKGTYRWRIESLFGAGQYSLCSIVP